MSLIATKNKPFIPYGKIYNATWFHERLLIIFYLFFYNHEHHRLPHLSFRYIYFVALRLSAYTRLSLQSKQGLNDDIVDCERYRKEIGFPRQLLRHHNECDARKNLLLNYDHTINQDISYLDEDRLKEIKRENLNIHLTLN